MTELTDRMRTCAAYLIDRKQAGDPWAAEIVALDAADLLLEASNVLAPIEEMRDKARREAQDLLGEPMEILASAAASAAAPEQPTLWVDPGGPLPGIKHSGTISPRACPQCGSRAHKRVFREGRKMMLQCPVCAKEWPYG